MTHSRVGKADTDQHGQTSLAAPCGLYCGVCNDRAAGECHACGCACGHCAGSAHVDYCAIAQCARDRGHESCADCIDLPCTRLIQFTNDPIWRTHASCIENLRRRRKIGTAAWLREQEAYWADLDVRAIWDAFAAGCSARYRRWQETQQLD